MSKNHHPLIGLLLAFVILLTGCKYPTPPSTPHPAGVVIPKTQSETTAPTATNAPTPTITPTPIPLVRIEQGDKALFMGDYERALNEYRIAFSGSSDPDVQAAALVGQGRTFLAWENYSLALSNLKRVISDYADSRSLADAYFTLGQTYMATFQYDLATDAYAKYLELRPSPLAAYVHQQRGEAFYQAGKYQEAIDAFQAAVDTQQATNLIGLQTRLGQSFAALGDYGSAIRTYLDIYASTSNEYTRAQMNLLIGQIYLQLGEYEQAYARFQDSVTNYPRAYDSYSGLVALVDAGVPVDEYQRGLVDYYAGQYGFAIDAFARYLRSNPEHSGAAHYFKGLSHRAIDEYDQAVNEFRTAIEDHPDDDFWILSWEELAYTQWAYMDRYAAAAETLLDYVARYPASSYAPNMLFQAAQIMERDGRLADAAATWERILNDYPASETTFRALFLAGIAYYRLENYPQAQTTFQRVLLLSADPPEQATGFFWVGKAQAAQGDMDGARQSWRQASQLDPTGYYSERAEELLAGDQPFSSDSFNEVSIDWAYERTVAESWVRVTFSLPQETNLRDLRSLSHEPALQRANEFHRLGLYEEARNEFEALREQYNADPANLMRLLVPMMEMGYYRTAILTSRQILDLAHLDDAGTLTAPPYFNYIRFGLFFADDVINAAEREGFDPYLLWSVIRQESMFEGHVSSSAGAAGLMQIMPATGHEIASRLNWPPDYKQSDLYRPTVNLRLGANYLARQRAYFDGNLYAALAAYNAGPGNAMYWYELADEDPDLFLEVIRFEETRLYIRQIYEFWNLYRRVYGLEE